MPKPQLLSDPFLQLPTETSVRVVWFTEFVGTHHLVEYGHKLEKTVIASTTELSRLREDQDSTTTNIYQQLTKRPVYRHEAEVKGLNSPARLPYRVISSDLDGNSISSKIFTLAPKPKPGTSLKILLTSDHQLKPMTTANLEKVVETVGLPDAIFFAGDLVNNPDRASEWFDDRQGNSFFPSLQGRAEYELLSENTNTIYRGAELIQHTPIYTAIGNHEVMGRFSPENSLEDQFDDAYPRAAAAQISGKSLDEVPLEWLKNNSFNTDSYEEIFSLPESDSGGKKYYAVSFGDLRLVVLFITLIWREPNPDSDEKGRYYETEKYFSKQINWGYGQHIFEPIVKGSEQYSWLEKEINSPEFQQAKYKVVMFHHPPHTLGHEAIPPYTDPIPKIERNSDHTIKAIRYEYPPEADYLIRDLVPLLESVGTQLVFYGHSHLWNRFLSPAGTNYLEASNVGNSYGAYLGENKRFVPEGADYAATGNPNGLAPIVPNLTPLLSAEGQPLPYIASNEITVFAILDTEKGMVSSYYFDTNFPNSEVVKFDEFKL
ncbi:MAG: metallophosphoesterase [Oscillatoria sp. PMC 1068.18]|nr:metallophosphoesterase [Oscillatoria sp. PMC 1076.18]MEC4991388.1 metallophosphoesterase [Oscillatoria sp. PMC 1068.18]